jgi:hypothetical protein
MSTSSPNEPDWLNFENARVRCDGSTLTIEVPIDKPTGGRGDGCRATKPPIHPTLQPVTQNRLPAREYAATPTDDRTKNGAGGSGTVDLTGGANSYNGDYSDSYGSDE